MNWSSGMARQMTAPLLGLAGGELVAEQGPAHGAGGAAQAWQEVGAAGIGQDAEFGEGLEKEGRLGGEDDVAGEGEVGARAGGDSVDEGDDGQGQGAESADEWGVEEVDGGAEIERVGLEVGVGKVLPGAEGAAGASDGEHANGRVGRYVLEGVGQLAMKRGGEAVELLGTVEGEAGDAGFEGEEEVLIGHGRGDLGVRRNGEGGVGLLRQRARQGKAEVYARSGLSGCKGGVFYAEDA